ncbi:transglutaminase-like putative cysteine protease [Frigoribacterium sp. PhB160]|uniref:transglutaminase family protein n=1 Tax=Frigoribacterium sp. PhB160 TaxID=2485192 RepID=UPI000F4A1CBD|nr:DUF3488 and transglutaminase-like domain-containing protein [Frigoribacterium sp. PhB160]ROS61910.1 transglutaminase-like putative cysteine protease [Frigoribacterium sp. PhB160]
MTDRAVVERRPTGPRSTDRRAGDRAGADRAAPTDARWGSTLLVWLTFVASLASLSSLFQGAGWWAAGALVSAVVLGVSLLLRALRASPLVGWLLGLASGLVVSTALVSGGTAVLGVVPTGATLQRFRDLGDQAALTIVEGSAPVEVSDGILGTVVVAVLAVAVVIDLVSSVGRMPGLTGVFPGIVLAVPAFVPTAETRWPWVVLTVLLYLVLLMVSTGRRPTAAGVVGGVAALALAGLATTLVPLGGVSPLTGVASGTGLATGVNPIVNLGDDLRRGAPVTVLSYRSSDADGTYLKLVDLVDFSGRSWSPAETADDAGQPLDALPEAPGVDPDTTRRQVETRVTVGALRSPYLPLPVPPTEITGLDDDWTYVDESGVTVRSDGESTQGLEYVVRSRPVAPTRDEVVATLGETGDDMAAYLSVDGVPESVTALAAEVTADAANPFDAAVALQDYFRDGDFTYSEQTPVEQGYDGSGLEMVQSFLDVKSGYCVHFASAMAVMARTLGIPSRMAVGFLPGSLTGTGDSETWSVSSDDLHTWPELWFQGLGWVPFEPTVGLGAPQSFLRETGVEPTAAPSDAASATPTPPPGVDQTTGPTAPGASVTPSGDATAGGAAGSGGAAPLGAGLLALVVLAAALVVPSGMRAGRRRRRLAADPPDALAAWREVLDTARDLGIDVPPGATPATAAARLADRVGGPGSPGAARPSSGADQAAGTTEARLALDRVLAALVAERFAAGRAPASVGEDARVVVDALRASSSPGRRLRAVFAPRSLAERKAAPARVGA